MKRTLYLALLFLLGIAIAFGVSHLLNLRESDQKSNSHQVQYPTNSSTSTKNPVEDTEAYQRLNSMVTNIHNLSYTMSFDTISGTESFSYTYVNIFDQGKRYERLQNQDGEQPPIYQKDGFVGYSKYTIKANSITDVLPSIFNLDLKVIKDTYDFALREKTVVGERDSTIIQITNKYSNTYAYQIILDDETNLPVKVHLVEQDLANKSFLILSEFRVSELNVGINEEAYDEIKNAKLSSQLVFKQSINPKITEEFNNILYIPLLPIGFKLISNNEVTLYGDDVINTDGNDLAKPIEYYAMTYFDGLFNFTVYVSKAEVTSNNHYYWRYNESTLYCEDYANRKIIIVSQLPISLAKAIVNSTKVIKDGEFVDEQHPSGYGQRIAFSKF